MKKIITLFLLLTTLAFGANQCIVCHKGIEDIRDRNSDMMKEILKIAQKAGHKGNDCIVCHGGNPYNQSVEYAHKGTIKYFKENKGPKDYYPAPASPWINENTCGMCHPNQVSTQMNSLMMSEQGKNPEDSQKRVGTDVYKKYMENLSTMEPQAFSKERHELPQAPTAQEIHKDPSLAVYTYLRQESARYHTGSKGKQKNGDYRGLGCSSCHIPYSNDGLYKGGDKRISKEKGHLLTHRIQSSRKVKVQVNDVNYSGVPVETCSSCHNQGKRIGVSYQGLIETGYESTYDKNAKPKPHTKRYLHMQEDVHYKKGMLCQDCHTSNDLHGDGFLSGANAAAVEIECQDCHGTTKKYPWELPVGYSDEFNTTEAAGKGRGVAPDLAEYLKQGYVAEKEDGYILSARGNPLPKAVKKGNKIIMHLSSGKDIELKPLKLLKETQELSAEGLLSMDTISSHASRMECYTCHASWAPQHYEANINVDYSRAKQNPDFLAASHDIDRHGTTGEMRDLKKYLIDGKVTQTISYIRWEEPALSQNGEGRISPSIPDFQKSITVIGKDGKALLENHIFKRPNASDIVPIQPHTIQKRARTCESCHSSEKALGLGVGGIKLSVDSNETANMDNYGFVDENATLLLGLEHHFKLSGPLSKEQRDKLDRKGVCISCHKNIPDGNLAVTALTHMSQMAEYKIDAKEHDSIVSKLLHIGAWVQVVGASLLSLLFLYGIYVIFFKKKPNNPRNEGWK